MWFCYNSLLFSHGKTGSRLGLSVREEIPPLFTRLRQQWDSVHSFVPTGLSMLYIYMMSTEYSDIYESCQ